MTIRGELMIEIVAAAVVRLVDVVVSRLAFVFAFHDSDESLHGPDRIPDNEHLYNDDNAKGRIVN